MFKYIALFLLCVAFFASCGTININLASNVTTIVAPKLQNKTNDSEITGSDLKGNTASKKAGDIEPLLP